jgi:hypothetical protein
MKIMGRVVNTRKTERYGLFGFISSIPGLVPVAGLPFAVLAVILGTISLKRIQSYPERYKGKGFAKPVWVLV